MIIFYIEKGERSEQIIWNDFESDKFQAIGVGFTDDDIVSLLQMLEDSSGGKVLTEYDARFFQPEDIVEIVNDVRERLR